MFITLALVVVVAACSFWLGKRRANSDLFQKGFESGKLAALNNKKQLIRTAFTMGYIKGTNESGSVSEVS